MGVLYRALKKCRRLLIPKSLEGFFFGGRTFFSRGVLGLKYRLETTARHDELYDPGYYQRHEESDKLASAEIAQSIKENFMPSSVIDVGCGSGLVLQNLRTLGVPAAGLEYSEAALELCRQKRIQVHKFDIESNQPVPVRPADLVYSSEVAEHLPECCADRYVKLLCSLARRHLVITAAPPGQGGTDHVNEQPASYWIDKFENQGSRYLEAKTCELRAEWHRRKIDPFRSTNLLVLEVVRTGC
jgi:SAM-dependent methyltransferase